MKKLLIALLVAASFIGCRSNKVVTETVYRDTVIYKERWDTISVPRFVPASELKLDHKLPPGIPFEYKAEGEVKDGNKSASYRIDSGRISVKCKEDAYMDTIKDLRVKLYDMERTISKSETQVKEVPVIKYKLPGWAIGYIAVTATALLVIGYIKGWLNWPIKIVKGLFGFVKKLFT